MIGLSQVTPWRWLLPPTRGLTPAGVVVVAALRSRTAASHSTVSLASAFAHALLPDGRRRVLLIKLNPSPLCVTKCLTHVWSLLRSSIAVTLVMLATGVLKPRSLMAANSASSSRCIDRMHSLILLHRIVRALFLALRASRSVSFSSPTLAVASSSDIASNSTICKSPSSSPSSAISTVAEPLELFRLKCASHRYTADNNPTHFKRNNPLVYRVSSRYNHGSTGSKQVYLARRRVYNHSTAHQLLIYRNANIITNLSQI
jgi:hypothetical protein